MTDLLAAAVATSNQRRYASDLQNFLSWAQERVQLGHPLPYTFRDLDDFLVGYITDSYDDNEKRGNRQSCVNARCAILMWLPNAKYDLLGSSRAFCLSISSFVKGN